MTDNLTISVVKKLYTALRAEATKVILGQDTVFEQLVIALLARGHVLMEGVPGTAKTLMAKTIAHLVQATFSRIQFTPDLMPADIVGTNVFDVSTSQFRLRQGPIFAGIVLADEVNRSPAKTQAALLEAMEERQVTIDGTLYELPEPFLVVATQNPVEYEGTYPLPEAQLDRFLFKINVRYPAIEIEQQLLVRYDQGFDPHDLAATGLRSIISANELSAVRKAVQRVRVEPGILSYITHIADASRRSRDLLLGGSPRASIALLQASKAYAALQGREYVIPDDVKALVPPVYRHRIILKPEVEIEGVDADGIIAHLLNEIEVPR
jgi:MoxR-like ATPase